MRIMTAAAILMFFAGCTGSEQADEQIATITLVDLDTQTSKVVERISRQELEARKASAANTQNGVLNSAVTVYNPCPDFFDVGYAYTVMYVDTGYNGADGDICIHGSGTADLSSYCYSAIGSTCWVTWAQVTKHSWYNQPNGAPAQSGYFHYTSNQYFSGAEGETNSSTDATYASSVVIN